MAWDRAVAWGKGMGGGEGQWNRSVCGAMG